MITSQKDIMKFIEQILPYVCLKKRQLELMRDFIVIRQKHRVISRDDFNRIISIIKELRELNKTSKSVKSIKHHFG